MLQSAAIKPLQDKRAQRDDLIKGYSFLICFHRNISINSPEQCDGNAPIV